MTLSLTFEHVGKKFDDTTILRDVTFETQPGEFVVLVGPSGCGKSTLLRLVAGLETITEGTIRAGDRVLNDVPPQDRGVGMVFQSYALYPHMTVRENLRFPLYVKKVSREQQEKAVGEVAGLLGLDALLDRLPKQLSGGQRQRVAIGRCLVRKPDIYCFDEPLSNLDASLRTQLRVEIRALQQRLNKTTLYVTHDQVEAMTLADRIVVLNGGIVQQVGSPEQLYTKPSNRFVAQFIGTPSMSIIRGECRDGMFRSGDLSVRCPRPDGPLLLGVRVEDVLVVGQGGSDADVGDSSADPMFEATVGGVEPVGESGYLHLDVAGVEFADPKSDGDDTALRLIASVPGHAAFRYQLQERVSLRLRSKRCHWFDVQTGDAVSSDDQEERP